jgi:stage II sporulation protein D
VYPTVAAFRDATGEPGWVAASTLGHTVRLQPRTRGVLRHEAFHVLLGERAHPRLPTWFREGLAVWLSGETPRREYAPHRDRVAALVRRHSEKTVLSWVERGVP